MTCILRPLVGRDRQDFELLEDQLGSVDAAHVAYYGSEGDLHAAAVDLLARDLTPDSNTYFDVARGKRYYSLWYYLPKVLGE